MRLEDTLAGIILGLAVAAWVLWFKGSPAMVEFVSCVGLTLAGAFVMLGL